MRDILCQVAPHDIDFATDARPDDMLRLLRYVDLFQCLQHVIKLYP